MCEVPIDKLDEVVAGLRFDAAGLLPAVVQDDQDGTVLMVAWMDAEAVRRTLTTGRTWLRRRPPAPPAPPCPPAPPGSGAVPAASTGAKATPPATSSTSVRCRPTATTTPCWSGSSRGGPPATRAPVPASRAPSEPARERGAARFRGVPGTGRRALGGGGV